MDLKLTEKQIEKRKTWAYTRSVLEADKFKHKRSGKKSKSHWTLFSRAVHIFAFFLKVFNYYQKGYGNAMNVMVKKVEFDFDDLPKSFDGYKILHLSDLHIGCIEGLEDIICERIKNLNYDLCVLTGDYRRDTHGGFKNILKPMKKIAETIKAKDGTLAILGNHDTYLMADYEDYLHLRLLINETVFIKRGNEKIAITGTDDPFYYYTDQAVNALEDNIDGFKIALVHTSELYNDAANNGYRLYLCGHTHGGQICLPGGIPLITHQFEGKQFFKGKWSFNKMKGYTSQGCGVSGIPLRFNSQSEVTLITLKNNSL